jgi:flavorubredoxin
MGTIMKISNDIVYVGVNDHQIDLFEGHYVVPQGMAYNSYLIKDGKSAVMDSVDSNFTEEWLGKIKAETGEDGPDYIVIQHMEPDHSGSIRGFMNAFPKATIVSSQKAFNMMANFYDGEDFEDRRLIVKEGDTLQVGKHTLNFVGAPMVHWPEVLLTYDTADKVLFSADAFGKFGALDVCGETGADDDDWACEARRYYFGIVGKYGIQVQVVLKKAAGLDIQKICPLHGPVLMENLGYYLGLYDTWSSYKSESEGVMIAYTSVYGNTKEAVKLLSGKIREKGVPAVVVTDLAREDIAEAVEDAFRYDTVVFATTTFNNDIFPFMKEFINSLVERNFQNKRVAFIENGSWNPQAGKVMKAMLEGCKNINYTENNIRIMSALNDMSRAQLEALADELAAAYK